MKTPQFFLVTLVLLVVPYRTPADWSLEAAPKEAPADLAAPFRSLIEPQVLLLRDGSQPVVDLWLRKELPVKTKPESPGASLGALAETTFLGAALFHKPRRDYRDDAIRPGLYTLRLALQPQDGNHLGTAEFNYFAVLVPASADTSLEGITSYKQLVKASSKATSTDHPVVLSLRPPSATEGPFPRIQKPAPEHQSILLQVPGKTAQPPETCSVLFDLVFEGAGKH